MIVRRWQQVVDNIHPHRCMYTVLEYLMSLFSCFHVLCEKVTFLPMVNFLKLDFLIWLKKSVTYKRYFQEHIKCKRINI